MTRSKANREKRRRAREFSWALGASVPGRVQSGAAEMPKTFGPMRLRRREPIVPHEDHQDEPPPAAA